MDIFVLRHGEAEPHAERDHQRRLTQRGEADVLNTLQRGLPELEGVQKILVSPYTRAQQTADIAADLLPGRMLMTTETLVPGGDPAKLAALIEQLQLDRVLLVGHQPLAGTFTDWLCDLEPGRYRMGTSALVFIETQWVAAGCGTLRWLKQPGA
ncbi:phosphohistidine phosphatase SixA [Exilibacterium tricleocarpae]|uniref:Phosphohistidine phosphatase SixA n=1 Tax=Exilibacterium tricleocarpae TaxID=2591008 RepID=A0A545SRU1_9GAMM|nr:phosphohistidine phosphatase SixA [Exilibacterium tricleocarpae]TQV67677.1 phosphohistidine phosphatase SixA [Exilibacterium tricleocarpae]